MLINLFLNYSTQLGQSISIYLKDEKGQIVESASLQFENELTERLINSAPTNTLFVTGSLSLDDEDILKSFNLTWLNEFNNFDYIAEFFNKYIILKLEFVDKNCHILVSSFLIIFYFIFCNYYFNSYD